MGSIIKDKNRSGKAAEEHLLDTRTCDILTYPIQSQKANGVRRKRIVLSIDDKLEIIQSLKQGTKASILAQRYGVGTGDDQVLEEALYKWFLQQRLLGAPISGSLMIQKAKQLNSQINGSNSKFRASSRWLYNFKQRHGIRCQRIAREISASESWDFVKQNLNNIVAQKGLLREQVYTCDETGLAWRCLPLTGRDRPLDRVTLLACSNASGLHKLRLTLVGKTIKPRCFRNIDVTALPIRYVYENNGWMTCELFKDWFFSEFVPSVKDHLLDTGLPPKAVLVLDFAPCHPNGTYLQTDDSNFSCLFLPVDSMHQHPMAQGIIANFKMHFRLLLLQKVLSSTSSSGNAEKFMKLLSLKDAADLVAEAWEQVQPSTLKTAWDRLWPSNQESSDEHRSTGKLRASPCGSAPFSPRQDRCSARITADAAPIRLSISRSILPSLVNKTPRYLNSSTWGRISLPTLRGHSTLFRLRTIVSDLEVLILIPAASHSAANRSRES
uniref:HTH CENPB-type domain-containing protein n=1 Tax=Erpetoichthys calabaricus TaxID=27687 RepID=A0A8C4X7D6_ERPCA